MPAADLLRPEFLSQLERLTLRARRPVRGWAAGQRRSRKAGNSIEFLDHRPYGTGDDLRHVDWNIFQRTDRLMVRQHLDDEELCVHLLVDASASMSVAESVPERPTKLQWATQLAASLAYVGLTGLERVGLGVMRERVTEGWPPSRGRARVMPLFKFLADVKGGGQTQLNASLTQYAARAKGSGLAILISDLLDADGYEAGLRSLIERGLEVHVVHLLSADELIPPMEGDFRLVDEETGELRQMRVDAETRRAYADNLARFLGNADAFCKGQGIHYLQAGTATPVEQFVMGPLRGQLLE